MINEVYSDLIKAALVKYKSFDKPDFQFVSKAVDENPYANIVQEISNIVDVNENTDINDDVCFSYLLKYKNNMWALQFSMIGLFGVFMRVNNNCNTLLTQLTENGIIENQIIDNLLNNHIQLLDQELLEMPVNISLFNTESDNTKIYQMLFSDMDFLPWDNN